MKSFCGHYNDGTCRSCDQIEVEYSEQVRVKEERLRGALEDFADWQLLTTVTSPATGFRNKAKLVVTGSAEEPILGLLGEASPDAGRELLDCPVHHPQVNELLSKLPEFIRSVKIHPYDISSRRGELKGIIVYYSEESQEAYLRFVLRSKESLDRLRKHLPKLLEIYPRLVNVSANIQPVPAALLEGEEEHQLFGPGKILHTLGDVKMGLGPRGFVQTNQAVARQLYETAASWAEELGARRFVELFSGQGAFSFFLGKCAEEGLGIEINPEAVERARDTATKLGLKNLRFVAADAAGVEAELQASKADLLLVNPPRRGLGESLPLLQRNRFPQLIYSSCSLESLVRDLSSLAPFYELKRAQIFDMFPHTRHFETLVLLTARAF